MSKYKVGWLNPEGREEVLLERLIEVDELDTVSATHWKVKGIFYQEMCKVLPELREVGISRVKKLITVNRIDNFAKLYKSRTLSQALGKKLYALDAWRKVSKESIARGIIPNICPVCKNPPIVDNGRFLVLHHWGPSSKLDCLREGNYRRICGSCNSYLMHVDLGWLYSIDADWKGQYELLARRCSNNPRVYPDFDGIEGDWSKFVPEENKIYEEMVLGGNNGD